MPGRGVATRQEKNQWKKIDLLEARSGNRVLFSSIAAWPIDNHNMRQRSHMISFSANVLISPLLRLSGCECGCVMVAVVGMECV